MDRTIFTTPTTTYNTPYTMQHNEILYKNNMGKTKLYTLTTKVKREKKIYKYYFWSLKFVPFSN